MRSTTDEPVCFLQANRLALIYSNSCAYVTGEIDAMILFLDFDGVLHPQYEGMPTPAEELFCHLPRFETVIREFPTVQIVVSSTWRYKFTLDQMRTHFSPDIAARIIDATPKAENAGSGYQVTRRENEILDWLAVSGNTGVQWVALDDAVWQFERYRDRVVDCTWYIGLDDAAMAKLRDVLAAHSIVNQ